MSLEEIVECTIYTLDVVNQKYWMLGGEDNLRKHLLKSNYKTFQQYIAIEFQEASKRFQNEILACKMRVSKVSLFDKENIEESLEERVKEAKEIIKRFTYQINPDVLNVFRSKKLKKGNILNSVLQKTRKESRRLTVNFADLSGSSISNNTLKPA